MSSLNINIENGQLTKQIETLVSEDKFSGVVLMGDKEKILYHEAFGYANKSFLVLNNKKTKFNIGSQNKMFTGVAVGQLVQNNQLSFDDTLSSILTDFDHPLADKITIHHLLTHTAGLGNFYTDDFVKESINYLDHKTYLPLIAKEELVCEPGEEVRYSNSAFIIAGVVVEEISNKSYYSYVQENIFDVAKMKDAGFFRLDDCIPNLAEGYTKEYHDETFISPWRKTYYSHPIKGSSAGGAFCTVEDMYNFSMALVNYHLLDEEFTQIVTSGKITPPNNPASTKISYGFGENYVNGTRIIGHTGGAPGCNSNLRIFNDNLSVVVLANYDPPSAQLVADKICSLFLDL